MSPALINTGAAAHNSFIQSSSLKEGQISSFLPISSLGFSGFISNNQIASSFDMNQYGQSGFVSSSEMNPNFEFSSPGTSKLGSEKPAFSSLSSLSKPRLVKSRKSLNSRSMGSSETRKIDPGFNPFGRISDNLTGVSSSMEREEDDDDVSINRSKHLNLKVTSKVEKVENALIDEIRKLRIENQRDPQSANHLYERSASFSGIQQPSKGVDYGLLSELPDEIKKLNLGGLGSESSKVSGVALENSGGNRGGSNVGGSIGTSLASELPNELKRLNLKDTGEVGGHNFVFGTSCKNNFVFGSNRTKNDSSDPGIGSRLPQRIKNLNIEDSEQNNDNQKEMTANKSKDTFGSGDTRTGSAGAVDTMILDEMDKLKIEGSSEGSRDHADPNDSSSLRKGALGSMNKEDSRKPNPTEFVFQIGEQGKHSIGPQAASSASSFPSAGIHFQPVRDGFQVPCMDGAEMKEGFRLYENQEGLRMPHAKFGTPDSKGTLFAGSNLKMEFSAKKESVKDTKSRGRKGKVKEPNPVLISLVKNFTSKDNSIQDEPSESYSPMDVSPYRETQDDEQSAREPSFTSDNQIPTDSQPAFPNDATDEDLVKATERMEINEGDDEQSAREPSFTSDNQIPTDSQPAFSNDATDEDLVKATERMEINEGDDIKHDEAKVQVSECSDNTSAATASSPVDSVYSVQRESFVSASENLDENGENEVESNWEVQSCDQTRYFSALSSVSSGESSFMFAASSSAQGQKSALMQRHHRKKNRVKVGPDICIPNRTAVLSDAATSLQFSPISPVSALSSQAVQKDGVLTAPTKGGMKITSPGSMAVGGNVVEGGTKEENTSPTAAARAIQEACEKWRLRGNQAYANGDLEKAEDCYSQGLSCIPGHETSRDCLRALVLCYSNRAATRMSFGRLREALQDCLVAAEIDPNFFRVRLRAANCYLALGEIGDASRCFKMLLQSTDVCVDRKIILEASNGLQKAQKVSECLNRSAEFLLQRTFTDAESVLEVIAEALVMSPYSEQLLESRAEALFMLRRYEEVIELCEQTLEAAERNSALLGASGKSSILEDSELLKSCSFWIWRYRLVFKSNFYLGKLEEALDFLEKQECWRSMMARCGNETLESFIPQLSTARELIRHKSAGNSAFQAGRHTEAVEHYTAALSFNVESRPFAAVCFGNRAAAYQALGQMTDAIADCSLAIALDGNYLKAISRRATLFEKIRDYEQAAKDLERFVFLLTKQADEKSNQLGGSLATGSLADLRQARQRLCQVEELARKEIPLTFYVILGVEPSVTAADLKKAYRKAALRHHPDKAGQSLARSESGDDGLWKKIAEEVYKDADKLFKMIGEAYAVLSDPTKRSQYDIEEEMRNGQKKSSSMSRMHTDASFYAAERGGSGRQWRETWRSSANPYSRGFEPTRPGRYY